MARTPHAGKSPSPSPALRPPPVLGRPTLDPLPGRGAWLWTCREGLEQDLAEELIRSPGMSVPRLLAPSLVCTAGAPARNRDGVLEVTFARQGFAVLNSVRHDTLSERAVACAAVLGEAIPTGTPWTLHTWVPDSTDGNPLSGGATSLHEAIETAVGRTLPALAARKASMEALTRSGGVLAQVCVPAPDVAMVGAAPLTEALSIHPGGRARMRVGSGAPSRAAMKLEEALDWLGHGPEPGDLCVDLGAAPGGWTWVLLERGARVITVDPGRLAPDVGRRRGVTEIHASAFDFEPRTPVDWLFCDMAWRPLEVAALLAKWSRRRWARTVVSNIKLPMRHKAEFLARVCGVIAGGGWKDVRTRHLYHDRDEITLTAWR